MNIDIFTFITRYSADYAEFFKEIAEYYLSGDNKINWKCIESIEAERLPNGFDCVAKSDNMGHNSMNHALAMNLALDYIESDYVLFVDADIAILYQDWDNVIISELEKYDCFGGAYNDKIKYKNFPTVYLFSFRKDVLNKTDLDFFPRIIGNRESVARFKLKNEASLYNMKKGDIIKCDTGWRLPCLFKLAGLTGKSMPMILSISDKRQLPFISEKNKYLCMAKPTHQHEWHYKGKLFATHKQASRNHPITKTYGKAWKNRILAYINQ